jgi:hypothetical protein
MRSSHGSGQVPNEIVRFAMENGLVSDISGAFDGPMDEALGRPLTTDEINDRRGSAREGEVSPAGPRPHYASIRLDVEAPLP